jgi:hypothetical protein
MSRNITNLIAIACSLALTVSTPATNVFARGGGGGGGSGRSSSGMSQSGRTMSTPQNFSRSTPQNFSRSTTNFSTPNSHMSNSHMSSHNSFKNGSTKNKFVTNKFQKQTMNKFSKSKSKYWKKYGGWGYGGLWGCDFGWGWGCWDSPWCYGWSWYEPLPVVGYYNPYCDCAGTVVDGVDYSGPISNMPANTVAGDDSEAFSTAREAFVQGNVDGALNAISVAALQMPQSQDMHQFHSLVLFAKGDYCRSATVAHAVLQEGPGWSWNTLQGFYPSPEVYTEQLRHLEHYVNDHPDEANARFLLGYHYLMLNHGDAGHRQMQQVVETQPKDKLAQNIVVGMDKAVAAKVAVAKQEVLQPVPDKTIPVNDNSSELETIVQVKKTPAKITPAIATPMVDEKSSADDDADKAPVNDNSQKVVVKRNAQPAPAEEKSERIGTDDDADKTSTNDKSEKVVVKRRADKAPTAEKSEKVDTDDDADKTPANDKSEKVVVKRRTDKAAEDKSEKADTNDDSNKTPANDKPEQVVAKDKADAAPTDGKSEKATTDDDDDKTPTNDKSDKVTTKGNEQNASTDEKSDKAPTDGGEDQPPAGDKSNKIATKGKADQSSTYEEDDQPPAKSKAKKSSGKLKVAKVSAESKTETVITDDKDNRESNNPAPKVVRPKRTRPIKRTTPANGPVGTFKASPEQGIQIELTLGADQAFTWKFIANGKTQRFSGKFKMSPNSLTLTRADGESMEGTLERTGNGGFKFRMKNAEADDPGLSFSR